jgi:hypothetical protein
VTVTHVSGHFCYLCLRPVTGQPSPSATNVLCRPLLPVQVLPPYCSLNHATGAVVSTHRTSSHPGSTRHSSTGRLQRPVRGRDDVPTADIFFRTVRRRYYLILLRPINETSRPSMSCSASSIISRTIWPTGLMSCTSPALSPAARHISSKSPVVSGVGRMALN